MSDLNLTEWAASVGRFDDRHWCGDGITVADVKRAVDQQWLAFRAALTDAKRRADDNDAEIARLTAELAAARAEVNCGQDGPCVKAPGCARHWQERNRELADELAAARAVPADVEAAIEELRRAEEVDARAMTGQSLAARVLAEANLRTAIARAIRDARTAAIGAFIDQHAQRIVKEAGETWNGDDEQADAWASQIHRVLNCLRTDSDGVIHDGRATAAPATVGGLLATAPVDLSGPAGSRWTNAIEWVDGETWFRIATGASADGSPTLVLSTWCDGGWGYEDENPMSIDACVYALPARLVPAAEADVDPSQRGPLPKGG